jgi:hypothetical protein
MVFIETEPLVWMGLFYFYFISEIKSAAMIQGHDTIDATVFGLSSNVFSAVAK